MLKPSSSALVNKDPKNVLQVSAWCTAAINTVLLEICAEKRSAVEDPALQALKQYGRTGPGHP